MCIHSCITRSTKIPVSLLGIRMLCIGTHEYQPGKRTYRLIVEYILEQLIAGTVRYGMVNTCMIVYVLVFIGNRHTTKVYFGSFSCQQHFGRVAGSTIMQSHSVEQYIAVGLLLYIQVTDTNCACMCFFQFIHIEYRILTSKYFNNLCRQEVHIIHCMVTNQQTGLRAILQDNQYATVHHKVNICTQDIYQLDCFFHHHILRHIKDNAILCKSGIESSHTIFRGICQLTVIFLHQFRVLLGHFFQATENHTFRQISCGKRSIIKCVIYHKIQGGTHIRHITLKHFIRIDRNSQTIQVQTEIRFKVLAHIRIFVLLHLTGRKSESLKIGKC